MLRKSFRNLGTYGLLGKFSPFSSGWGDTVGQRTVMANGYDRFDNMITYASPEFAGIKVFAQYSFKNDSKDDGQEGKADVDRYYGIGVTADYGAFSAVAIVDQINAGNDGTYDNYKELDDPLTATIGATYDFGFMKIYGTAQYFDNVREVGYSNAFDGTSLDHFEWGYGTQSGAAGTYGANMSGYGIALGASAPMLGGTVAGMIGYMDADNDGGEGMGSGFEVSRWNVAVGYSYNFSKRTSVYTAAAYTKDDLTITSNTGANYLDAEPSSVEVMAGLIHRF